MDGKSCKLPILFCTIILAMAAFTGPASAATITIDNSSSIADALLNVGADGTVILEPGIYFISSEIEISNSSTIRASDDHGADDTVIDAQAVCRIFNETGGHSLTIEDLTLRNGVASGSKGGAIYCYSGEITLTGTTFTGCSALFGGALFADNIDNFTITSCEFTNCSASGYGGAFTSTNGNILTVASCGFTNCSALTLGGGFSAYNFNTLTVTSCEFTGCSALYAGAFSADHVDTSTVTSSDFTDCTASGYGGAIHIDTGTLNAISSTFTNCSADGDMGGAIYIDTGTTTVTSSTFTNCSAENGGAISNDHGTINAVSSTFTNCTAESGGTTDGGGAIYIIVGTADVTSSTFEGCSADGGGAIYIHIGTINVTSSGFTNCSALTLGGAFYILGGTTDVTSSTFEGCHAPVGGAIIIDGGTTDVTSSTFTDCGAESGGAICFSGATATVTSSTFEGCHALEGGAICMWRYTITITSSNFTNCGATSRESSYGGAISILCNAVDVTSSTFEGCHALYGGAINVYTYGSGSIHLSRIYNCSTWAKAVHSNGAADSIDATNNWWGTNADPSGFIGENTVGAITYDPWLVLGASSSPAAINAGGNSVIRADLRYNSDGDDTSGSGYVPDGIPVTFGLAAGPGSLSSLSGVTGSGVSATTYSSSSAGTATINTIADNQTVNCTVLVNSGGGSSSGGSRSGGGSNSNTGVGASENLKAGDTASFNFDGKGSVDGLLVTVGDNTAKLMVTVERRNSLPSSIDAPDTEVYEYEDVTIYYAEPSGISGGTFEFKVEKSWLSSNGFENGDIVMMHYNEEAGVWEELSTTLVREEGGYYYYSAKTPSFSWFAIAVEEGATIVPEETTAAVTQAPTTGVSVATTPVPSETQAVTVPKDDNNSWAPTMIVPILGIILVGIIAAVIVIRKRKDKYPDWWNKEFK
jgi:PGF-pre-PGF domain-containing protein